QVLADSFQVDIDRVKITATTTAKVPNTSATAASSGSDLNGMAAYDAARHIKERLVAFAAEKWDVGTADVVAVIFTLSISTWKLSASTCA
ncbi:molybdopterin cofactor-binding domain-containing protein, partial [Rhizobium leguminosarum]|uniref:molybdopterin cofactor-binding domain-containing protein n=1 Tax=Rhizobium leguminosarum TaxID=384 RepID=UPI003F9B1151